MMYCPKCGAEYRDGFTECADCRVHLVAEPPAVQSDETKFTEIEEVLSTGDPGLVALVKSLLDAEDIPYLAQGEQFNSMRAPLPVRFLVPQNHLRRARELLKNLL